MKRVLLPALLTVALLFGVDLGVAPLQAQHSGDHTEHSEHEQSGANDSPLTEPGNAEYAALQEAVERLREDPDTDWSEVDLEALRKHLIDMRNFTLHAEVVEREEIPGGLRVRVTGENQSALASIRRAVTAHAPMLEREFGWNAETSTPEGAAELTVTSDSPAETEQIRGLGYIGLMASGAHHKRHHWMIATGRSPHVGG